MTNPLTPKTKTPMTAGRKQLLAGLCGAVLVAGISVPVAFAALDDGQYCVTATGFPEEGKSFTGERGICPAEPGTGGGISPVEPVEEPSPIPTIAPFPETTPTSPPADPASCDLDAANSAAEDLSMRAMFSDPSNAINNSLRSSIYDAQPSIDYENAVQTTTLSVNKAMAAEAYCAGESLAGSVSIDHFYSVSLRTSGGFMPVTLGSISGKTTGTLADPKSLLTRQTLNGSRTDGVYSALEASLHTVVSNEIRKDLGV
jgi:hypothetical protein